MMRFVQSYARTHAHAYSHTPMRRCPRTMTRSIGTDGNPTNRDPGLRKRAPSTALGLLGVSPPASQEGTSAILWRCILLALRSERASSADEDLILWTLDIGLALALAPTHLHGIECPPMPNVQQSCCSRRPERACPYERPRALPHFRRK